MGDDFSKIFVSLRSLYSRYAEQCVVTQDTDTRYYLGSHEVRDKDGYRTGFGGAEIKKNYVSAHLMPVYIYPGMLDTISDGLKKRMQGKSCFNFKKHDPVLFSELESLIAASIARYKEDARL